MNTYTPNHPRAAFGLAAAAMATITMAAMVVLPAELEAAAPAGWAATLAADANAFVARRILEADEMEREDEAERAVLAMPVSCLHAAEPDPHGT